MKNNFDKHNKRESLINDIQSKLKELAELLATDYADVKERYEEEIEEVSEKVENDELLECAIEEYREYTERDVDLYDEQIDNNICNLFMSIDNYEEEIFLMERKNFVDDYFTVDN